MSLVYILFFSSRWPTLWHLLLQQPFFRTTFPLLFSVFHFVSFSGQIALISISSVWLYCVHTFFLFHSSYSFNFFYFFFFFLFFINVQWVIFFLGLLLTLWSAKLERGVLIAERLPLAYLFVGKLFELVILGKWKLIYLFCYSHGNEIFIMSF